MANNAYIEELFNVMMQFGKIVAHQTQESHEEKVATMLQFAALHFLKSKPAQTVGDLANDLKLSKSSTTQLIKRLSHAGLVKRDSDKDDLRITRITLTPGGEEEMILQKKKMLNKIGTLFSKVPQKDIKELIRIYRAIIEGIKK